MSNPDERAEIRALARDVAENELRPRAPEWDRSGRPDPAIFDTLGELGFLGLGIPEERGGLGLDLATLVVAVEELARGDAGVALAVGLHNGPVVRALTAGGEPAFLDGVLEAMAAGDELGTLSLGELYGGAAGTWIPAPAAKNRVARFGRSSDGTATTLVDAETAGRHRVAGTVGLRGAHLVSLDDDPAHLEMESAALGDESLDAIRALGHLVISACALGVGSAALEAGVEYANEREQFGRPIGAFGAIRVKVADMVSGLAAARLVAYHAAELSGPEAGPTVRPEWAVLESEVWDVGSAASLAAMMATGASSVATDEAVQVYGGYGYMQEYPVEKWMRDAQALALLGGRVGDRKERIATSVWGAGAPRG